MCLWDSWLLDPSDQRSCTPVLGLESSCTLPGLAITALDWQIWVSLVFVEGTSPHLWRLSGNTAGPSSFLETPSGAARANDAQVGIATKLCRLQGSGSGASLCIPPCHREEFLGQELKGLLSHHPTHVLSGKRQFPANLLAVDPSGAQFQVSTDLGQP